MTAQDLQSLINQWANLGWTLNRMSAGETQGFLHAKDVFLSIFKREVPIPVDLFVMIDKQPVEATEHTLNQLKIGRQITPKILACFKGMTDWRPFSYVVPDLTDVLFN